VLAPVVISKTIEKMTVAMQLFDMGLDDAALEPLSRAHWIQNLDLGFNPITDAALIHIGRLTGLTRLSLHGTRVTDAGLTHVTGLSNLKTLNLDRTRITRADLKYITRALPKTEVVHDPDLVAGPNQPSAVRSLP
jgi:hypothetical protein